MRTGHRTASGRHIVNKLNIGDRDRGSGQPRSRIFSTQLQTIDNIIFTINKLKIKLKLLKYLLKIIYIPIGYYIIIYASNTSASDILALPTDARATVYYQVTAVRR